MLALIAHPKAHGEVFNIGHTKEISIYDLAVLVKKMTGSASEIVLVPYEEAYEAGFEDMPRRVPDISKIQRLTGYRPMLDLPEMLERVIAYERDRGR
jgi:UDP-glucose 4-epimerase